ncbi:MAG: acyltransferase family protein [Ruminococcus sp.]|nr:acyltransferase family protein [Ruminococcus sp.]
MKTRIKWVDFSKGIAILLVIIGHTIGNPIIRGVIFSFHMPLFFIVSGYTSRCSENTEAFLTKVKVSAHHLLLPAYCIFVIRLILYIFIDHTDYQWPNILLTPVFASGDDIEIGGMMIPAFGMMWFLVVLFGVKTLYDWLQLKFKNTILMIVCIILSSAGMVIGHICALPFCFDLILATLLFFHVGQQLKSCQFYTARISSYIISATVWIAGLGICGIIVHEYLELATRSYPLYFLSYVTAIAGCMFVFLFGAWLEKMVKIRKLYDIVCFLGKNSMILYVIHAFDTVGYQLIKEKLPVLLILFLRLTVDLTIMYGYIMVVKNIKKERK